jgi:tight adherence protein B
MSFAQLPQAVLLGAAAFMVALLVLGYLMAGPRPVRLPAERRRPGSPEPDSALTEVTKAATSLIDKALRRRGRQGVGMAALDMAGVRMRLQDFALLVLVAALTLGALGLLVAGPVVGLALGLLTPIAARMWLNVRTNKRQRTFADQLDDSLQLMASSLRAGHSLLQALASVAREAEEPTSEEFARIINETRVGRELGPSFEESARRMKSDDFAWVTQAIAINREVGGNLAEVLDGVGHTIRERNQIRRQVKALSAEGKLSAIVLMLLPFGIAGFLMVSNPGYMAKFTQSLMGYTMIVVGVILLVIGGLWLRKVVKVKF